MKEVVKWDNRYFTRPKQFVEYMKVFGREVDMDKAKSAFYRRLQSVDNNYIITRIEVTDSIYQKVNESFSGISQVGNEGVSGAKISVYIQSVAMSAFGDKIATVTNNKNNTFLIMSLELLKAICTGFDALNSEYYFTNITSDAGTEYEGLFIIDLNKLHTLEEINIL